LDAHSESYLFLETDARNAFNEVSRARILDQLRAHFPELVPHFLATYCQQPPDIWFLSEDGPRLIPSSEGSQQGDPLGPFYYCLAVHSQGLLALSAKFPKALFFAYCDNLTVCAEPSDLAQIFSDICSIFPSIFGLEIRLSGCRTFGMQALRANFESHCLAAHLLSREALDSIKHFNPSDGVRVLGSFLGSHDAIQTVLRTFIVKSIQQLDLLSQLGDFQCMYLLLRYCVCAQFSFLLQTLPYSHTASFVSALTDIFARFVFQTLLYPELATSAISTLVAKLSENPQLPLDALIPSPETLPYHGDVSEWSSAASFLFFPIRLGGLGLPSFATAASGGYFASCVSCLVSLRPHPLFANLILSPSFSIDQCTALSSSLATYTFLSETWGAIHSFSRHASDDLTRIFSTKIDPFDYFRYCPSPKLCVCAKSISKVILESSFVEFFATAPAKTRARLLSTTTGFAGSWLGAFPGNKPVFYSTKTSSVLSDDAFRLMLIFRLGLRLPSHFITHCVCGTMSDPYGYHFTQCSHSPTPSDDCPRTVRHDKLRDVLVHFARSDCGFSPVKKEVKVVPTESDQRRMDLQIPRYPSDTERTWIDVGITSTIPEDLDFTNHMPRLSVPLHAITSYANVKHRRYNDCVSPHIPSTHLVAAIADPFGAWHPPFLEFLRQLAKYVVDSTTIPTHIARLDRERATYLYAIDKRLSLWMTTLSCSLQRDNAEMILQLSRVSPLYSRTAPRHRTLFLFE